MDNSLIGKAIRERLIREGKLTPQEQKPEWLRNLDGSVPPRTANWVPANKDGTPKTE